MQKTALDYNALTGAAYGTAIGGGIGAYASTATFPKGVNRKQRLALILAGALAGSSAGASIGATTMRKKAGVVDAIRRLARKNVRNPWKTLRGKGPEETNNRRLAAQSVRRLLNRLEELEGESMNKLSAYVSPSTISKLTARLAAKSDDIIAGAPNGGEVLIKRLNRLSAKEVSQNTALKYSPGHQLRRLIDKVNLEPENLKKLPGIVGSDLGKALYGVGMAKLIHKITTKKVVPPTKLQQFIVASPKYIAGGAAVAAGTYLGNKTARFKLNPSILSESGDDLVDAYIMYKAQQRQILKELANREALEMRKGNTQSNEVQRV